MAGEQKYTVDIGVTGLASLNKLQSSLDTIQRRMLGLKALIGTGIFAGLGVGALRLADDLQDLSNATGITTARLLELQDALVANGGAADQMAQGVTTFARSIDEAAQGSLKAQNTFRELGISLQDLRSLSEQELMARSLKGISNISDASRRAAIQMELFGKSFRTVDAGGLAADIERTAGSQERYAESLRRGAELNDGLARAAIRVRLAFLEAFSPLIQAINNFNTATAEGESRMNALVTAIKIAGAALVTAFSVGVLLPLVTAVGTLGRGIGVVSGALGAAGIAKWASTAFKALGPLMSGLRVIALLFSAGLGIYTASKLFDDFGSIASNALSRIVEGIGELIASILNLEPISGILNAVLGTKLDFSNVAGNKVQELVDKAKRSREEYEKLRQSQKKVAEESSKTGEAAKKAGEEISRAVDTSAFDNAAAAVRKIGTEFEQNGRRLAENIELETRQLGLSREAIDLQTQQTALANRTAEAVQNLRDQQAAMSKELKDAGLGRVYDEEIAKVQELSRVESERLTLLVKNLNAARAAEEFRLYSIRQQLDVEDKLLEIQRKTADLTLTDIEKGYRDIQRAAEDSARAAIRAEEARRGSPLSTAEVENYYKKAREGVAKLTQAQKNFNDQARSFSTGWRRAFNEYVDAATNAAKRAERMFEKFTSGIEDLIVDFAKTGKFEWKNFVNSMLEELLRSNIKSTMAQIFQMRNPFSQSGGTISDLFGGVFDALGGGAGQRGQSPGTPLYVVDVAGGGANFGSLGNNPLISGGGFGGGSNSGLGGIFDSVKNVVGSIGGTIGSAVSTVGKIGGGIFDAVKSVGSSIFSGIGDLFGGFFANGGTLGAGKIGIVGERGPELIKGSGTITPVMPSQITYNINAVDAASFQALVARDPAFIYSVTQQGARTIAGRR
jgi:lambda family phage tail tape measure protein